MFYKMPWIRFLVFSVVVNLPPLAASANQSPVPVVEALFGEVAYLGPAPCQSPCEIIYQQQQVDTCHRQNDLIFEEHWITTYEPVWETEMRTCHYTVAKPETRTIDREVRCVAIKPVWETQVSDRSYNIVRQVVETKECEERYTISRPVMETECREQKVQVQRCVTRTVEKEIPQISQQPVTRMKTTYVDQGQYVTQQIEKPRRLQFSFLKWASGGWGVDPSNGKKRYELPGFVWVKQSKTKTISEQVWQARQVAVEVPETTYEQVVTNIKVPTEVSEWVTEEEIRRVPVCVCKMVTEECVRIVPVTTCREVIERVENKVTIPVCRYIREEEVRRVPYTYTRMMYEQRVREVPVRVCKMVPVRKKIFMPRSVQKIVPGKKMVSMPQLVVLRQNHHLAKINPMFLARKTSLCPSVTARSSTGNDQPNEGTPAYAFWKKQGHRISQWAYDKKRELRFDRDSDTEPESSV